MRIGYIHVDYEEWTKGSYNTQEIGLAKAFEKLGHEVIIVYWVKRSSDLCFQEVEITKKIKKLYLPTLHFKHHVIFNPKLLLDYHFDLLHIQSDNLLYVPNVVRFCKKHGIPYYCYIGTINSSNPSLIQKRIIDLLVLRNIPCYRRSKVLVKTPRMKEQLAAKGVKDIVVAPVGLDLSVIPEIKETKEELKRQLSIPLDKTILCCVSRLEPGKQPLDFFKLAPLLDDSYYYIFIGDGIQRNEFHKKLEACRLGEQLRYIQKIANDEIHKYLKLSDYLVNFNDNEIFGMSILEAMYQGCTVVAKKAPGPEYILEDGDCGFLVSTIEGMAETIKAKKQTKEHAVKRVLEHFTWDRTAVLVTKIFSWIR